MPKETIVIKGPLPSQAVDKHLKQFGHLPTTPLCNKKGDCQEYFLLLKTVKAIGEYSKADEGTDYQKSARKRMIGLYEEWCQFRKYKYRK